SDTNAFIELSYNPFNEILDKVIQVLNTLRGKDLIRKWQYEQIMPDRTTCELAHLYFNPKTHKTIFLLMEKKIYKQTTGGAMGSSLTLTLANIFMSNWQKNIVEEQTKTGDFYGR
ncbi:unnamed protein product, partial [Rotaria socialis]